MFSSVIVIMRREGIKAGTNTRDSGPNPGPKFASIKMVFKMQIVDLKFRSGPKSPFISVVAMKMSKKFQYFAYKNFLDVNIFRFVIYKAGKEYKNKKIYLDWPKRTSDGGNGNHCIDAYNFAKNQSRSNASIFIYKLAVGLYFMILHVISYFHEFTALFWC